MSNFLDGLNPPQREAAEALLGPLLILAGAGSGKTRVLTYRVANLILQGEASPQEILAVTFTNKAAKEMQHRIHTLLDDMNVPIYEELWISTFHSTCARILREDIHRLGYQPFFVIYDDSDQKAVIKRVLEDLGFNDKIYPPKQISSQISNAKMLGLKPEDVPKKPFFVMDDVVLQIFEAYESELKLANALDFDDLLLKTYELFKNHEDVLKKYQERFKFIMVDEYQDTNHIQYLLMKILSEGHRNICVVGDEDQSIYSWRGADIRNILDFEKDFPETKVVKLEENYRSTRTIVEAASHVIKQNSERKDKTLFTNNPEGSKIIIQGENNEYDEARFVVRRIQDLRNDENYVLNDFAVFYRTNAQSRVLEEQLRSYSIPYRVVGSVRFYDRKEIKDVICYLRLILNPTDDVAFYRILNVPGRGIGKTTADKMMAYQFEHKVSALKAAQALIDEKRVHSGAQKKISGFLNIITNLRMAAEDLPVHELYVRVLDDTGYALKLKQENNPEAQGRLDNLEELQNAILQFEKERGEEATLQSFLEEMALISDADRQNEDEDAVTLMTLHLSKGLEYDNVFIVGNEEGLFPSNRGKDENDPTAYEEERRLAYVGMTRAQKNLHLSYAKQRRVWGQEEYRPVSRFLSEIPEQYITLTGGVKKPKFLQSFESRHEQSFKKRAAETRNQYSQDAMPSYEDFGDEVFEEESPQKQGFKQGQRVRHPIFGVGSIFEVEGNGERQKVSVLFQDKSLKKFMTKHARLELI